MSNTISELEAAAAGRVQREAEVAKSAWLHAEEKMSQENKKEMGLGLDHYQRNYAEKEAVYQETVKCIQESCGQY